MSNAPGFIAVVVFYNRFEGRDYFEEFFVDGNLRLTLGRAFFDF
jgi:hypothetical protein